MAPSRRARSARFGRTGPAHAPYTAPVRLLRRLLDRFTTPWHVLLKEMSAFGVVGAVNLFVDVGLFNLLHFRVGLGPTTSNVLSTGTATTISYFGNRHWSFSHRARTGLRREYSLFILINLLALALSSVVVAGSFYVLGLTSPLALNAAKFVGIALGTVFRFWSYKRWVFPPHPEPAEPVEEPAAA